MTSKSAQGARVLLDAYVNNSPIEKLPDVCIPRSFDDAYAIHDAMVDLRGPVAGWKVAHGPPSDFAPVFSVAQTGAMLKVAQYNGLAVEVEFGFRVKRDLPVNSDEFDQEYIYRNLEFVPLMEIISSRYVDKKARTRAELLADSISSLYFVVGDPIADWYDLDFKSIKVELAVDGEVLLTCIDTHPVERPATLVVKLVDHLARRHKHLRAGNVVTTGALRNSIPIKAGDRLTATFGRSGEVEAQIL